MRLTEEQMYKFYIDENEYLYCSFCKCEVPIRTEEFEDEIEESLTTVVTCDICKNILDEYTDYRRA